MHQTKLVVNAVIFDMDGLMLDTERIAQEAWQQAGAEWGYDIPDEVYLQAIGRTAADTADIMIAAYGSDFPFDAMYARKQALLHKVIEQGNVPTKPGLFELLDWLDACGLPKAVATSTARAVAEIKLSTTELQERFPVVVCGDEVEHGKPAPDIFLKAAAGLGIDPSRCLVLEDSESGTRAAHAAGMIPIIVPDLKQPSDEVRGLAYQVVDDLHEVRALIQNFLDRPT